MKKEMKGLIIIGLILTSIVGSSFAFNMQNMNNDPSTYFDGIQADTSNWEFICPSKTGAVLDILDSSPCNNPVTIYNLSIANDKDMVDALNSNFRERSVNNSELLDIEFVEFKFIPVISDYFNVTVDENNIVRVTQLQDVVDNEQVMFLKVDLVVRNKTTGQITNINYISFLADKNPHVPNVNKNFINPQPRVMMSDDACKLICGAVDGLYGFAAAGACVEACIETLGVACAFCVMLAGATLAGVGIVCWNGCKQAWGP